MNLDEINLMLSEAAEEIRQGVINLMYEDMEDEYYNSLYNYYYESEYQ